MSLKDAQKALSMIQRAKAKGRAVDVSIARAGSGGTYDIETGLITGGTPAKTFYGIGVRMDYRQADIDGTRIQQGDQILYVPAQGFTKPVPGEQITAGGTTYNVESVGVLAPGTVDVLYTVQVRGVL